MGKKIERKKFSKITKRWCVECDRYTKWKYRSWRKHSQCMECGSWSTKARWMNPEKKKYVDEHEGGKRDLSKYEDIEYYRDKWD